MNPPTQADGESTLTPFQIQVAQLFFDLPASDGFLLAGGAALIAQHLTTRPTQDLDFFTRTGAGDVPAARDALAAAAEKRGWTVERHTDTPTFCRLVIHGPESLLVDLAVDAAPGRPPTASFIGPTFAPDELAGRKLIALFDRAAARDFADVYVLALRYRARVTPGRVRRNPTCPRPTSSVREDASWVRGAEARALTEPSRRRASRYRDPRPSDVCLINVRLRGPPQDSPLRRWLCQVDLAPG